jgi:hypothetical protein
MILGMTLAQFTQLHVIISLIAIVTGIVVMFGMIESRRMPILTAIFLLFTILTSATGFLFPFTTLMPSHMVGILSLVLLAIAVLSLYALRLRGALVSLYLNVFVLIIQGFMKVDALKALAPTQSEPPFVAVQGACLVLFVIFIYGAVRRFRPA